MHVVSGRSSIGGLVSVTVAANELNLSPNRVRQLIKMERLPAQRIGREFAITREDLEAFKRIDRPMGRPPRDPEVTDPCGREA